MQPRLVRIDLSLDMAEFISNSAIFYAIRPTGALVTPSNLGQTCAKWQSLV